MGKAENILLIIMISILVSLLYLGERTDMRSLWKLAEADGEGEDEGEALLISELLGLG